MTQVRGAVQHGPIRQLRRCIDRGLRGCIDGTPASRHIEILERQSGRVDQAVTRPAGGVLAVQLQPRTHGLGRLAQMDRQIRIHAGRRRSGRGAQDPVEHPGTPQHRGGAVAIGGAQQHGSLAKQPPTILVLERHPPELRAVHALDVVLAGERLIDEGVIGIEQVEHAAILEQHAGQEEPDLGLEIVPHLGSEGPIVGLDLLQLAQVQPGEREVLHQRLGARILEHALNLGLHDRRIGEPLVAGLVGGEADQLLVGALAPQKEGEARGQLQIIQRA